jgi:sugar phosphate isomerase/epimerase
MEADMRGTLQAVKDMGYDYVEFAGYFGKSAKEVRALLCKDKKVFKYENTPISPVSCYIPIPEENAVVVIPVDERMVEILRAR